MVFYRRRSLHAALSGFNGYPLLTSSDPSVAYNLIDTRNAFTTRSLDPARRDTVLSGLLLHVVRRPSTERLLAAGGINVQSKSVAQLCASEPWFRGLISACVTDAGVAGNTSLQESGLGGIGNDPVFNRYDTLALALRMHPIPVTGSPSYYFWYDRIGCT